MAEVTVTINGRNYGIACDDGQEKRVVELGQYINTQLRAISSAGAATTESHLLVLTSLVLADELQDVKDKLASLDATGAESSNAQSISDEDREALGNAVEHLNQRVIQIANRLKEAA